MFLFVVKTLLQGTHDEFEFIEEGAHSNHRFILSHNNAYHFNAGRHMSANRFTSKDFSIEIGPFFYFPVCGIQRI